jgi:hypothetical protein
LCAAFFMKNSAPLHVTDLTAYLAATPAEPCAVEVGTVVGYSRRHLASIRVPVTDPDWGRRGTVVELLEDRLVRVLWQDDGSTTAVSRWALARPGTRCWAE